MAKKAKKAAPRSESNGHVAGAMTVLRKLSTKTICGTVEGPAEGKVAQLYTISGVAGDIKVKPTTYGDATALLGRFLAVRADGAEFSAAVAYLPEPMASHLAGAVKAAQADYLEAVDRGEKPAMPSVQFALRIGVKGTAKRVAGDRGYEYQTDTILAPEARGAFDELRALATGKPLSAIAGPKS